MVQKPYPAKPVLTNGIAPCRSPSQHPGQIVFKFEFQIVISAQIL
jgi:hypothetical protein